MLKVTGCHKPGISKFRPNHEASSLIIVAYRKSTGIAKDHGNWIPAYRPNPEEDFLIDVFYPTGQLYDVNNDPRIPIEPDLVFTIELENGPKLKYRLRVGRSAVDKDPATIDPCRDLVLERVMGSSTEEYEFLICHRASDNEKTFYWPAAYISSLQPRFEIQGFYGMPEGMELRSERDLSKLSTDNYPQTHIGLRVMGDENGFVNGWGVDAAAWPDDHGALPILAFCGDKERSFTIAVRLDRYWNRSAVTVTDNGDNWHVKFYSPSEPGQYRGGFFLTDATELKASQIPIGIIADYLGKTSDTVSMVDGIRRPVYGDFTPLRSDADFGTIRELAKKFGVDLEIGYTAVIEKIALAIVKGK